MNHLIKDTLAAQADQLEPSTIDLDAIVSDGQRRLRRRRVTVGIGAAAAVAALAIGATWLPGLGSNGNDLTAAAPPEQDPGITWASGSTLHTVDGGEVTVDHPIWAYAETHFGWAYADPQGQVWRVDGDAESPLGQVALPTKRDEVLLTADQTQIAFVDIAKSAVVVVNLASDQTREIPIQGRPGPAGVSAIDADTVWFTDARGTVSADIATGEVTHRPESQVVVDAVGDSLLLGGNGGLLTPAGKVPMQVDDFGSISPDQRFISTSYSDAGSIFDARGNKLPFEHGHDWAIAYSWVDGGIVALTMDEKGQSYDASLTRCALSEAGATDCTDVAQLPPDNANGASMQLPIGVHLGD